MMTELLRDVFMYAPDATIVVDQHGLILLANEGFEDMFGYRGHEIVGRPVEVLIPIGLRMQHTLHRGNYMLSPERRRMGAELDLQAVKADGSVFRVQIMLAPAQHNGSHFVIAAIRPILEDDSAGTPVD